MALTLENRTRYINEDLSADPKVYGTDITDAVLQARMDHNQKHTYFQFAHMFSQYGYLKAPVVTNPSDLRLTLTNNFCRFITDKLGFWELPEELSLDFYSLTPDITIQRWDSLVIELFRYNEQAADSDMGKIGCRLNYYVDNLTPVVNDTPARSTSSRNTNTEEDHVLFPITKVYRYQVAGSFNESNFYSIVDIAQPAIANVADEGVTSLVKSKDLDYKYSMSVLPDAAFVPWTKTGSNVPAIVDNRLVFTFDGSMNYAYYTWDDITFDENDVVIVSTTMKIESGTDKILLACIREASKQLILRINNNSLEYYDGSYDHITITDTIDFTIDHEFYIVKDKDKYVYIFIDGELIATIDHTNLYGGGSPSMIYFGNNLNSQTVVASFENFNISVLKEDSRVLIGNELKLYGDGYVIDGNFEVKNYAETEGLQLNSTSLIPIGTNQDTIIDSSYAGTGDVILKTGDDVLVKNWNDTTIAKFDGLTGLFSSYFDLSFDGYINTGEEYKINNTTVIDGDQKGFFFSLDVAGNAEIGDDTNAIFYMKGGSGGSNSIYMYDASVLKFLLRYTPGANYGEMMNYVYQNAFRLWNTGQTQITAKNSQMISVLTDGGFKIYDEAGTAGGSLYIASNEVIDENRIIKPAGVFTNYGSSWQKQTDLDKSYVNGIGVLVIQTGIKCADNKIFTVHLKGNAYQSGELEVDIKITGYANYAPVIYRPSYINNCVRRHRVRQAIVNGYVYIIIGDIDSTWGYNYLTVDCMVGYGDMTNVFVDTWAISRMTTLPSYTAIYEAYELSPYVIKGSLYVDPITDSSYYVKGDEGSILIDLTSNNVNCILPYISSLCSSRAQVMFHNYVDNASYNATISRQSSGEYIQAKDSNTTGTYITLPSEGDFVELRVLDSTTWKIIDCSSGITLT